MIRSIRLSAHWAGVFLTVLVAAACSKSPEQLLASAEKHLASEDYKAAIIELKNALSEQPELARGRYMLGRALLATGDSPSAEKELRLALKYQFPEAQVIPPLAKALVDQQQYDKVLTEFGNKKVGDPEGDAELLSSVGSAQLQKGAMDKAEAAFQQALKLKPGYVRAELGMAQLSAAKGDLQTALGITEAVLAKQPQEVSAMMLRGALFVAQRKTTEALQLYERAAAVAPDNLAARFASVSLLIGSNRMDEAGKRLDELRQRAPKHPQTQYLSALVAQRKGDLPAARDAILQVLRVAPDHVPSLALAGSIEYSLRSFPTAALPRPNSYAACWLQPICRKAEPSVPAKPLPLSGPLRTAIRRWRPWRAKSRCRAGSSRKLKPGSPRPQRPNRTTPVQKRVSPSHT